MSRTLRGRLAIVSALTFGLLLAAAGAVSYRILAYWLDLDATMRLTELTEGLRGYLRFDGATPRVVFDERDPEISAFIHDATQFFQLYDATTGCPVLQSDGARLFGLTFTPDEIRRFRDRPRTVDLNTRRDRLRISNSLVSDRTSGAYLLQVGVSLGPTDAALRRYRHLLFYSGPGALVVAALTAWGLGGVALSPLARVADAASTIDVRSLGTRLPVRGTDDELDQLVVAFNGTLERLDSAVAEMRQFSAALAHELRTPLAILRGELELNLRQCRGQPQMFAIQLEEIDRLKRLIDQILTLARAESGQIALTAAPVDIGDLANALIDQLQPVADARELELLCRRHDRVIVNGDAGWLQRLLINLLDNALKFTPEGGRVTLDVFRVGRSARVTVSDTGVGMSPEDSRRAFDRFFRADPARSSTIEGAGLGLSLAQWIVESHHGTITLDSCRGVGSTFTVTLPAAL
jgi:heavy metal sensor kinase